MSKKVNENLMRPAATPDTREQQLVALATDLAEKQLRDGTASPSVITHYLRMGSPRETMERDALSQKNDLDAAKAEAIRSEKRMEEMIGKAMDAFRSYSPTAQDYMPEQPVVMNPISPTAMNKIW